MGLSLRFLGIKIIKNDEVCVNKEQIVTPIKQLSIEDKIELMESLKSTVRLDYKSDIFLNCNSKTEYFTRANSCKKEPETIDWLEKNISPGDVFYDVGANVGAYTMVAHKVCNKIKVYSFEPSYSTFSDLVGNILLNEMQEDVFPINIALSESTSINYFNYSSLDAGEAAHTYGEAIDYVGKSFVPVLRQYMASYSLDDVVKYIESPTVLKIDVDGIEEGILRGAENTLKNGNVRTVLVELVDDEVAENGDLVERVINLMKTFGYKVESKHPYIYGKSLSVNYIFQKI
jgi:FkbM family methyltransferase